MDGRIAPLLVVFGHAGAALRPGPPADLPLITLSIFFAGWYDLTHVLP
jgi:hypothetical protein